MASPDVTALPRSNLNDFLFANVGIEARGMTLSVILALARQGLDPWREAGRPPGGFTERGGTRKFGTDHRRHAAEPVEFDPITSMPA
jgi:hypothetical protein